MAKPLIPENLISLHDGEELLRGKSIEAIHANAKLRLHMEIVECAMDVLDSFRSYPTDDEDIKVVQVLGMRQFNAFASALKLMLSGYNQTSALILRDVLETVFLIDYFSSDRHAIAKWRTADKAARLKDFKPVKVREALDKRDGFTSKRRAEFYELFSELAGHPSMKGIAMLKPLGMNAQIGPFFDVTALDATLSEMGRLALQVGEVTGGFMPLDWTVGRAPRQAFTHTKNRWFKEFYPNAAKKYQL